MNWEDDGFLLSKRKFRENAIIINVFTSNYGKVNGIVYGGTSRKIKNFLQIGNKIFIFFNSKNENKMGYFKTELVKPISPKYFNDKKRTSGILSSSSILSLLLPEGQSYIKIYKSFDDLLKNFDNDNWILLYILWEFKLIKELGFDPNLEIFKNLNVESNFTDQYIDKVQYKIPLFLIKNTIPTSINNDLIKKSLIFTRLLMLNKFFIPNNLIFPRSRIILENYFN
jgi:DNA repair protein RecO (recombination protein O)|tara:strand:- start:472 stop:1149 length:678 start_codon:yes stop_codon:yes gene_type:complete